MRRDQTNDELIIQYDQIDDIDYDIFDNDDDNNDVSTLESSPKKTMMKLMIDDNIMTMMLRMTMMFAPWKAVPLPGNPASLANAASSSRWVWTSRKFVIIIICNFDDDDDDHDHDHQMMIN